MVTELLLDWKLQPKDRSQLISELDMEIYREYNVRKTPSVLCGIQTWEGSKRFPKKIYAELAGVPMYYHTLEKVALSSYISTAVIAAHTDLETPENYPIFIDRKSKPKDLLSLYWNMSREYQPDYIVRITSDCPTIDPLLLDYVILQAINRKADYCTNVLNPKNYTFPDGQDIEVLSFDFLKHLNKICRKPLEREHVTIKARESRMLQSKYRIVSITNATNYGNIKLSVDTEEDLRNVESSGLVT